MDNSFIYGHCTNCASELTNASQIFSKITIDIENNLKTVEISILDAILYIYGFSATNLASAAYLENGEESNSTLFDKITKTSENIVKHGLSMCSKCVILFKELYVAFYQLKKLSSEAALLTKAIKKFSPSSITIENEQTGRKTERDDINIPCRYKNIDYSRNTTPPEKSADTIEESNSCEDLFEAFNFEQDYADYENEVEDVKTDPLVENKNSFSTISSSIVSSEGSAKKVKVENVAMYLPMKECSVRLRKLASQNDIPGCSVNLMSNNRNYSKTSNSRFLSGLNLKAKMKKFKGRRRLDEKKCRKQKRQNKKLTNNQCTENNENSGEEHRSDDLQPSSSPTKKRRRKMKLLKCRCGKACSTLSTLASHEKVHDSEGPVTLVCDICKDSFDSSYSLYVHKSMEHFEFPHILFTCDLCGMGYATRTTLRKHQNRKHGISFDNLSGNNNTKLKCSCGKSYRSLHCLRQHENRNLHSQEPIVCNLCGEAFKKFYLLYKHKSIVHCELPEITFKCKFCEAKYVYKQHLKVHEEQNHPEYQKSFICDKCGAGFNCLKYLRKHTRGIHKDEGIDKEQFRCTECGILLKHSRGLRKHILQMHRSQRTYVCEQCGKTTKNMTNMRIHMKIHDPNRNMKTKPPALTPEDPLAHLNEG